MTTTVKKDHKLSSDSAAHIHISGVSKRYGDHVALHKVDLEIKKGEFFSLLGPSGCGKTTLLKILGGFEDATEGELFIDGERVNNVPPHRRCTNMVFQNYALFPHLDVVDNIGYGLRRSELSSSEKREKIEGLVDLMQLGGFESRNVDHLSGGQKQRVALARALAMDPSVLLLDEPLGALDKQLRDEMQVELRAIQQRVGITFIFVTHDQEEAMALSDRVAVLFDGKIAQVDSPRGLYDRPRSEAIAGFIGNINLLDACVVSHEAELTSFDVAGLGHFSMRVDALDQLSVGRQVRLAIRPERISVNQPIALDNALSGNARCSAVSFRGDRSYVELEVPGLPNRLSVVLPNIWRSDLVIPSVGDSVDFACRSDDLVLFRGDG